MPPKATPTTMTASRSADIEDTSMEDTSMSNNIDNAWMKTTLQQLTKNQNAFKMKIDAYNHQLVKMSSIEKFADDKAKLKEFFTQIKI